MKNEYPCKQVYRLMLPDQAVGAGKVFFDFFNATSATANTGARIIVSSVKVIVAVDVANAAVVGANLHLHKTTSAGTGGTAATTNGVTNTAATISTITGASNVPAGVTARLTPTGAAAIGVWIGQTSVVLEELNFGATIERWLHTNDQESIVLRAGEGLKVIQGTVAAEGTIGFVVEFGILEQ